MTIGNSAGIKALAMLETAAFCGGETSQDRSPLLLNDLIRFSSSPMVSLARSRYIGSFGSLVAICNARLTSCLTFPLILISAVYRQYCATIAF